MIKVRAFIGGLFFGGLAGVALGVLTAPKPGARLRSDLVDVSDNFYRKAIYEFEELADKMEELSSKLDEETTALKQMVSAASETVQDFSPGHKLNKKIEQAQHAMQETDQTTAESQQLLHRTEIAAKRQAQ